MKDIILGEQQKIDIGNISSKVRIMLAKTDIFYILL